MKLILKYLLGLTNAESDEGAQLIFGLLARLPGWPAGLSVTLHDVSRGARPVAAVRPAQGAVDAVSLVRQAGRYRGFDAIGRALSGPLQNSPYSVLSALTQTLPATARHTLGLNSTATGETLAVLLRAQLPASRRERLTLLGWTPRGHWLAPGTRLLDGRVGYALSGRGNSPDAWRVLLSRLRELFPALHAAALEARLAQMLQTPTNVFRRIADLEDDYTRMDNALQRWLSASLGGITQTARQIAADRLRWAWRDQGDISTELKSLTLSGLQLQSLPDFPPTLRFPTINRLVISDTSLTVITSEFLGAFDAVEEVNLSGNRLLRLPSGLAYLVGVQRLQLARNLIRLDAEGWNAILGLPNLRELNLSDNPLTTVDFSFHQLPRLRVVTLRRCRLSAWPQGLELCGLLERADLRDNLIGDIPDEILQMPHVFRRGFLVTRNRLSDVALRRLYALDPVIEHLPSHDPLPAPAPLASRAHWLPLVPSETRRPAEAVWDALQAQPNSQGLFSVLDWLRTNVENSVASASLARQVWTLLWGMQADDALRERLFEMARIAPRDQNGVSERFSTLLRRQAVARAEREFAQLPAARLFTLAQGLFRLDRLDALIRVDLRERLDAGETVDEVALALTYRVRLREALQLPFQPRAMVPCASAEVGQGQLDAALRSVRDSEVLEALVDSFSPRAFWQAHLRHRHPDAFAALDVEHQARLAALDRRAATLEPEALALERELLMAQRDAEQQGLVRQLTRELLFGRERGLA